jgi:cyanophycinase
MDTKRLADADGIFFSGGDQLNLTAFYGGSPMLTVLKERYINERIVIAGTSAGAMALSTPMIFAGNKEKQLIAGEIKITIGLEFVKDVCIDTHFVDRSRFIRMAQVVATNPSCIGIGIEEDTAIILRDGKDAEVLGNGVVIVLEGYEIKRSNITEFSNRETISIEGLKMHVLSKGSKYEIKQINPPHK